MKTDLLEQNVSGRILSRSGLRGFYDLRLARDAAEVRAAQTLRFLVFNLELNEGLEQSHATFLDADPFDDVCEHLIVEDIRTNEVVGTYRLQTGVKAAACRGYYSAQEFDLSALESRRTEIIELGRACVHSAHRNLTVLSLLWKGIADYAKAHSARYLVGCSSLSSQDPTVGASAYTHLSRRFLAEASWRVQPLPDWSCSLDHLAEHTPKIPKLLTAYLSIGAKICGPPALDREFKTIDFFTLLDLASLPADVVRRYLS